MIGGVAGTTPGGACTGSCNLMGAGVEVSGPGGDTTTIAGNFLGTDVSGTVALPGTPGAGISVHSGPGQYGGALVIGGTSANARNVIAGSIEVQQPGAAARVAIHGNYVGVDTTGSRALSSAATGIAVIDATGTVIGGTTAGHANVISGYSSENVRLLRSTATAVQGNIIGPAADGSSNLNRTTTRGVLVDGTSSANRIGAAMPGGPGGNVIAHAMTGITVEGAAVRTIILSNSIFGNSLIGIDLNGNNVSSNDACDADGGANLTQNHPVLGPFVTAANAVMINGNLNSVANGTYLLEFFASPAGTVRQGRTPIGSTTVTTNAACAASFSLSLPLQPVGTAITATATDANGNTSEFSAIILVPASLAIPTLSRMSLLVLGIFFAVSALLVIHRS
jgi:hypothetical protein